MSSPITEEAKKVIAKAPKNGPLTDPFVYANALPPQGAALAEVLRSRELVDLAKKYLKADTEAMSAQTGFNRVALFAACTGFLATFLGGLLFYVGSSAATATAVTTLWVVQSLLMAVCLISLLVLYVWKPFRTWRTRRSDAEVARVGFFARIVRADETADALSLALRLECFQRHLFEDQMKYFRRRGEDKRREARRWRRLSWIAVVLTVIGSVPQAIAFVQAFNQPGWLFEFLGWLTTLLPGDKRIYAFAWFASFQVGALTAILGMTSRSAELWRTYQREFKFLEGFQPYLSDAREAAANGNPGPVNMYAHAVTAKLTESVRHWASQDEGLGFP